MTEITVSEPFSVELYGEVHVPYGGFGLEICAALFREGECTPFAFASSALSPSTIDCLAFRERDGRYITLDVDTPRIDVGCTQLIIAAHPELIDDVRRKAHGAVNPTIKHLTLSARKLEFGLSATFTDEDVVYGTELIILKRTEQGWSLDDTRQPTPYPELTEIAWGHGVELTPFGP